MFGGASGCARPGVAREPGVLVLLIDSPPESLDRRLTLSANGQRLASLIQSGLVRIGDQGEVEPDLAERFERIGTTRYRFHLRPGLTFHDGSPLTAADVVYTYESLRDPKVGSPLGPKYEAIESVEAVDPHTVDIVLAEPFAPLLLDLTMGIVPAQMADPAYAEAHPVPPGAGPFRFAGRPDEEHIRLEPFENWWGGAPRLRRLEVVVARDETTRVLSLLHGEADLVQGSISPVLLPRLEAAPHLRVVRASPGPGYAYLGFNLRHPILSDVRVRRAIAHAIDRESITRYKFKGAARPASGMLPEGHWAYGPARRYAYDPKRARALLAEAGYPDGFEITYKTSTDRFRRSVALVIKKQLEAVGIRVDLRAYEWGTFYGDIKRGNFEITTLKWTPVIEPHLMHWTFHSTSIPSEENGWVGGNRGAYRNPEVDRLLDEAAHVLDPKRRAELYRTVQRILAEDLPYVPLWHEDTIAVVSDRVEGFHLSPWGFLHPLAEVSVR
ncbi:MAG: ABC transporter substrate-binding protein [Deltaproteobacteria bacterium]|nr:MAG: ABC transporter substrate-binding protein [Deltaproteobacteria bacterium]